MFPPPKDRPAFISGYLFTAIVAAAIWLKFISVDYAVADVLNWPTFGVLTMHALRHTTRALAVSLPSLGAILCLLLPLMFFPPRRRAAALIVMDMLLSALVLTDRLFIRYYADIFIFHDLMLVPQTGLIAKSIWALLKPWDFLIFADLPLLIWLLRSGRLRVEFRRERRRDALALLALFLISVAVQGASIWHLKRFRPNIINAMYDRLSVCAWVSTSTFHWWDFFSLTRKALEPQDVPPETVDEIGLWFKAHRPKPHPGTRAKNLILVQCEALQYFVVDLEIGGVPVTPNLNRFKEECLYFPNTWSQVAAGNSSDAEFMANTGLFPAAFGAAYTLYADNDYNSLARAMRSKRGARAVVVQGTRSAFWNCHRMHPKLWFHRQYSQNTFPHDEVIGLGLSDEVIFSRALQVFKEIKTPFHGFIVTLSSHHPFDFAELPRGTLPLPPELQGTLIGNYLLSINYFDQQFGLFIDELRRSGLLDKSLVVVYGDHPAIPIAYREDMEKLLGKKIEEAVDWKETRRIPLFFRSPETAKRPRVDERNVGQMDILPTVSGLMKLNIDTVFGKDLLSKESGDPVIFRNGSYIVGDVYVEPAAGRATKLGTGEHLDCSAYDAMTDEVERRLKYNDLVLEKNLIEKIISR